LTASERATCTDRNMSLAAEDRRLLRMKSRMFGTAMAASVPATASVIISSNSVKPRCADGLACIRRVPRMGADYIHGPQGDQGAPTSGTTAGTDGAGAGASVKKRQM
jgi:hypothetical protein